MRSLPIEKWTGAGNDFVVVDAADVPADVSGPTLARLLCARGTSIGSDGLIIVDGDDCLFWNPDGSTAAYCGNGARCLAARFIERRPAESVSFTLGGFRTTGRRSALGYAVSVPPPSRSEREVPAQIIAAALGDHMGQLSQQAFITAGVPHLVLSFRGQPCWLLMDRDAVVHAGAALRHDPLFGSEGTNVDFIWRALPQEGAAFAIRTYERGVEGETLACGTGVVAAALAILEEAGAAEPPGRAGAARTTILVRSGDVLGVERVGETWTLDGPARCVLRGEWCGAD